MDVVSSYVQSYCSYFFAGATGGLGPMSGVGLTGVFVSAGIPGWIPLAGPQPAKTQVTRTKDQRNTDRSMADRPRFMVRDGPENISRNPR